MNRYAMLMAAFAVLSCGNAGAEEAAGRALQGEWTTDCLPIGKGGRHGYVTTIRIDGALIEARSQIYAKSACQTPTVKVNYRGRITRSAEGPGNVAFEHTVESITFTLNNDEISAFYNKDPDGAGCGIANWKTNEPVSVAGRTCAPFSFAAEGVTLYDRAWLSGSELRFGNFPVKWDALSDFTRPSKPSQTVFHRVGL